MLEENIIDPFESVKKWCNYATTKLLINEAIVLFILAIVNIYRFVEYKNQFGLLPILIVSTIIQTTTYVVLAIAALIIQYKIVKDQHNSIKILDRFLFIQILLPFIGFALVESRLYSSSILLTYLKFIVLFTIYSINKYKFEKQARIIYQIMNPKQEINTMPMKWYNFLLYVQLYLAGFLNFSSGIKYALGLIFNISVMDIKRICILLTFSIIDVFLFVFSLRVRDELKTYKTSAVKNYFIFFICTYFFSNLISINSFGGSSVVSVINIVSALIMMIIYLCLNYIYFNKRRHLFINN